jgi:voltage-gated sodium channel
MDIVPPVMELRPFSWAFFILLTTFTMFNLFIGVIVSAIQSFTDADKMETIAAVEEAHEHIEADLHSEVRAVAPAAPVTPRRLLFASGRAASIASGWL